MAFTNVGLENFEVSDLSPWLSDLSINYELINPMAALQNQVFVELFPNRQRGKTSHSRQPAGAGRGNENLHLQSRRRSEIFFLGGRLRPRR